MAMTALRVPVAGLVALEEWVKGRRLRAREWQRVAVIRRSAAGEVVPQIARSLGVHEQMAREWVKRYLAAGPAGLVDRPRAGGPRRVTEDDLVALEAHLDADALPEDGARGRAWSAPQAVEWLLKERGVTVTPAHVAKLLRRRGYRYKRTKRGVTHKRRDPLLQASRRADLELLH
jgi:transposase